VLADEHLRALLGLDLETKINQSLIACVHVSDCTRSISEREPL
jgi:hypothetical protein